MKHATRMAMTWHAMKNPDKRGVQRHHGSDPADMPNTSIQGCSFVCRILFRHVTFSKHDKNDMLLFLDCSSLYLHFSSWEPARVAPPLPGSDSI